MTEEWEKRADAQVEARGGRSAICRTETDGATVGELRATLASFPDAMRVVVRGYELGVDDLKLFGEIFIKPDGNREEDAGDFAGSMVTNSNLVDGDYYGPHAVVGDGPGSVSRRERPTAAVSQFQRRNWSITSAIWASMT